jgi:glycosyltransferase involved in cell wall biosynthesis
MNNKINNSAPESLSTHHFLFCPASEDLNKHNETGSNGQLSYEFLSNLSHLNPYSSITAIVMQSHYVHSFRNVKVITLFKKKIKYESVQSLIFYVVSYLRYLNSDTYKKSDIVHHLMPFSPGRTFNLFFIFKNQNKKYIIGPIVGPHTNLVNLADESRGSFIISMLGRLSGPLFYTLSMLTIRRADTILFTDQYAYNSFKSYIRPHNKVVITGLGITSDIHRLREIKKNASDLNILFVGRLTERKGCEYVIKALSIMIATNPNIEIHCVIAGDGPLRNKLEKNSYDCGLSSVVEFTGGVESNADFNLLYNMCDIVCLPVLSDTWMSAKEALSCGKPVIITDIGSHSEHVQDGFNGFLIPPRNENAIATVLLEVANDRNRLNQLSRNAYKSAQTKYDWNKVLQEYLNLLD